MRVSSFDIFDTCIIRKCGTPRNLFDVLSYKVFSKEVSDEHRIEFITQRLSSDDTSTFDHLYDTFDYSHPFLLSKPEIKQKELECERDMMVPVITMLEEVNRRRELGNHIIFVSDMYLPTKFLRESLSELGFFKEKDAIYVSGDVGRTKHEGSLYKWIKEEEKIEYANWQHYGDDLVSDIQTPSNLGITVHPVNHCYLPYEDAWIASSNNLTFHTGGIMAGIGRSIYHSIEEHPHNAFAIDITAPLSVSFALRVMNDAVKKGIKRLYFCSRDCYAMYHVAKKLERITPDVKTFYFYTSREALYNTPEEELISYLSSIGMAQTDEMVGVVDIRSTGKSLQYLNTILNKSGYKPAFGYYMEMYCSDFYVKDVPPYYCEINRLYCDILTKHNPILEMFLGLCPEQKTINYEKGLPVKADKNSKEDFYVEDLNVLSEINLSILKKYTDCFIETDLYHHIDEVFQAFVIPTIRRFFNSPHKDYLQSLRYFSILQDDRTFIPYVREKTFGLSCYVCSLAQTSPKRFIRRLMKLIIRIGGIKPVSTEEWWPEGTKAFNS